MIQTKLKKTYNLLIKIAIIILSFGYIFHRLFFKNDIHDFADALLPIFHQSMSGWFIFIITLMMFLNWSVETFKWQIMIKKIEKVKFFRSFSAVWAGLAVGSFTPNRIGEFFGRAFILQKANRWEGSFITMACSFSQLLITIAAGLAAFYFFIFYENYPLYYLRVPLLLFTCFGIILFVFYFKISLLQKVAFRIFPGRAKSFGEHFRVFSLYSFNELLMVLFISLIRYIVFASQFYLVLRFTGIDISFFTGLALIAVIYLLMSSVPVIAFSEVGTRGAASMLVFEYYSYQHNMPGNILTLAFASSTIIWLINILIPTIIGAFLVFRLKFIRK